MDIHIGKNKEPKKQRFKMTGADKDKRWARKELGALLAADPILKRKYLTKILDFEVGEHDPVTEKKNKVQEMTLDAALQALKDDPELLKQIGRQNIMQLTDLNLGDEVEDYDEEGDGTIDRTIRDIDRLERAKKRLGVSSGALGGLITPEVLIEALKMLGGNKDGSSEHLVAVQLGGHTVTIPESQYQALLQKGQVQPIAAVIEAPKVVSPETKPTEVSKSSGEPKPTEASKLSQPSELPEVVNSLNFDEIVGYFELPPEAFVDMIEEKAESDVKVATVVQYLKTVTYDTLSKLIEPYLTHPKIAPYAEVLKSEGTKVWIEAVIQLLKVDIPEVKA